MLLTMSDSSPINTVFSDESGNAVYKTSTPKMGGTTFVSAAVRENSGSFGYGAASQSSSADASGYSLDAIPAGSTLTSPAGETQLANLASIDFHEYKVKKSVKRVIVFRGAEKVASEWLRKVGAGTGWYGSWVSLSALFRVLELRSGIGCSPGRTGGSIDGF